MLQFTLKKVAERNVFETPTTDKALIEFLEKEIDVYVKNKVTCEREKMELTNKVKQLEAENNKLRTKVILLENKKSTKNEETMHISAARVLEIKKGLCFFFS